MNIEAALSALGVNNQILTPEEKEQLDRDGFLALPTILTPEQVSSMNLRLEELMKLEGEDAGKEVHQELGTERLADLINKDAIFDICFTHPRVLAGIAHVLRGEFKLSSLNYRAALPNSGHQDLHVDWSQRINPPDYCVCNSIWLLDDFTPENGPTRVVPGSQRSGQHPKEVIEDRSAPHPQEVKLLGPAGMVVIFNSHTWHGGTLNTTSHRRRALHSYFTRREYPQQLDQRKFIRPQTYNRLSEAMRYILDV